MTINSIWVWLHSVNTRWRKVRANPLVNFNVVYESFSSLEITRSTENESYLNAAVCVDLLQSLFLEMNLTVHHLVNFGNSDLYLTQKEYLLCVRKILLTNLIIVFQLHSGTTLVCQTFTFWILNFTKVLITSRWDAFLF